MPDEGIKNDRMWRLPEVVSNELCCTDHQEIVQRNQMVLFKMYEFAGRTWQLISFKDF